MTEGIESLERARNQVSGQLLFLIYSFLHPIWFSACFVFKMISLFLCVHGLKISCVDIIFWSIFKDDYLSDPISNS